MVIVATGISGTGEKQYSADLKAIAQNRKQIIHIFNVGEMILEQARKLGIRITKEKVLNMHRDTIRALRADVFDIILSELTKINAKRESVLINIHAAFYWKNQYVESVDYHYLSKISPDFYINFLNNSDVVMVNLKKGAQWAFLFRDGEECAIEKIMEWQTVEHLATTIVANFSGKPVFVIPAGGCREVLYRFMFERWRKVFYLGMPLTFMHGEENKDSRERIDLFARWLENYVNLMDPRFMEPLKISQLTSRNENKSVHHHIVGRDLNILLPQCDGMIGFYPKEVASYGENCEREEKHRTNGDTFLIYPKKEFLSPFFTEWADEIFSSEEEFKTRFLEYLGKEYLAKVEEAEKCYTRGDNG